MLMYLIWYRDQTTEYSTIDYQSTTDLENELSSLFNKSDLSISDMSANEIEMLLSMKSHSTVARDCQSSPQLLHEAE